MPQLPTPAWLATRRRLLPPRGGTAGLQRHTQHRKPRPTPVPVSSVSPTPAAAAAVVEEVVETAATAAAAVLAASERRRLRRGRCGSNRSMSPRCNRRHHRSSTTNAKGEKWKLAAAEGSTDGFQRQADTIHSRLCSLRRRWQQLQRRRSASLANRSRRSPGMRPTGGKHRLQRRKRHCMTPQLLTTTSSEATKLEAAAAAVARAAAAAVAAAEAVTVTAATAEAATEAAEARVALRCRSLRRDICGSSWCRSRSCSRRRHRKRT